MQVLLGGDSAIPELIYSVIFCFSGAKAQQILSPNGTAEAVP